MSQFALGSVFQPAAIALVGASPRTRSLGRQVLRQLREGGFPGPLGVVNPHYSEIDGLPTVASLRALQFAPELVIIAVPPVAVIETVREAAGCGAKAVVVLTRHLSAAQRADMMVEAAQHRLRVLGPNCLGVIAPYAHLYASFSAYAPPAGDLALISLNRPGNRGGCFVIVNQPVCQYRRVDCSSFPPPRQAGCNRWPNAVADG